MKKKIVKKKAVKQPAKKKVAIQKVEEKPSALAVTSKVIDDYLFGSGTKLTEPQKQMLEFIIDTIRRITQEYIRR